MKKAILTTKFPEINDKIRHIEGYADEKRDKLYITKYKTGAYLKVKPDDELIMKSELQQQERPTQPRGI